MFPARRRCIIEKIPCLAAAVGLLACGGEHEDAGPTTGGGGTTQQPEERGNATSGEGCEPVAEPGAMEDAGGRWAALEIAARLTRAPGFADPIPNQTVTVFLWEQTQAGEAVTVSATFCDHTVHDPEAPVRTLIPEAYKRALQPFTRDGTFRVGEDAVGQLILPDFHDVRGARLDDVAGEPLPTEPDDPRVVDMDGDGMPGVTVRIGGLVDGELYVVARRMTRFDGVAVSPDRIEGLLELEAEEVILASDPPSIKELSPTTVADPDPCRSTLRLVRIPEEADCGWILERVDSLFP